MNPSDISVIIPIYNRVSELLRTMESLQVQTLEKTNYEVVIADDGSSEDVQVY